MPKPRPLGAACEQSAEQVEPPVSGPLEPPFSEIIPESLGLYSSYVGEETTSYSSGLVTHSRYWGNRAAFPYRFPEDKKPQGSAVTFILAIREYQDEELAQDYFHEIFI